MNLKTFIAQWSGQIAKSFVRPTSLQTGLAATSRSLRFDRTERSRKPPKRVAG